MASVHAEFERAAIGVVGAGRVGAVLASRLRRAGHHITAVSGNSAASRTRVETMLPGVAFATPSQVADAADLLLLTVPDDVLPVLAAELAGDGHLRPGQIVVHTSGRHGAGVLDSAAHLGARVIAMHPAMTFTGTDVDLDRLAGCVFGLTAAAGEQHVAESLVADLEGEPVWVPEEQRTLYHAALTHGANHLVTLVSQAMSLLRRAGAQDPSALLRPLLGAALENVLAYGDAALTGPVARGDVTTVRAHVDALADGPVGTLETYLGLARATARRAADDGRIDAGSSRAIQQVLAEADRGAASAADHSGAPSAS